MDIAPPEVYASVDWFSLTTGQAPDAYETFRKAQALAVETLGKRNRIRPFATHGYRGFGTRHIRAGIRDRDCLIELSGQTADRYWRAFFPHAKNVTRIDPCVDVHFSHDVRDVAQAAYDAPAVAIVPGLTTISNRLVRGTEGGQTCYVGSPKSDRMGRLYDKHAESGGEFAPNTWRYEVQCRNDMGSLVARALHSPDDVRGAIAANVHDFYCKRGIQPWFQADSLSLPSQLRRTRTDLQRCEKWLHLSVAPVIRRWADRGQLGPILAALGLEGGQLR